MTMVAPERRGLLPFQRVADDRYTCVPPAGYEKDPAVTRAIREFDPNAIPLWRIQRWRFPDGQERNLVHHGIGRYFPVQRYLRRALRVEMPAFARWDPPNVLDVIFEDDNTLQFKQGGPGDYVPWDWATHAWCRFQFDKTNVEAWMRRSAARIEREKREAEALAAELEYRKKQIEPWLLKRAESLSEYDWKQYLEAVWGSNKDVKTRASKPFVDLGRSPRPSTYLRVAPAKGVGDAGSQEAVE